MISTKIGVLDSGVGGLSVLSELVKEIPSADYTFFGDTKNVPYGTKTPEEIFKLTKDILNFFYSKDIKNVVFACNTTSAVAYDKLSVEFDGKIKIFPLIQPCAKFAIEGMKDDETIAILATSATIKSKKYNEEIAKINPNINVLGIECSGFVEIVENRLYEDEKSIKLIESKFEEIKKNNIKKVVLGCTHYPYLEAIFKKIVPECEFFNPAKCIAKIVKNELCLNSDKIGNINYCVSKSASEFLLSGKKFFDIKENVELVELN